MPQRTPRHVPCNSCALWAVSSGWGPASSEANAGCHCAPVTLPWTNKESRRPSPSLPWLLVAWRPSLLGWRPVTRTLLRGRPSLLGKQRNLWEKDVRALVPAPGLVQQETSILRTCLAFGWLNRAFPAIVRWRVAPGAMRSAAHRRSFLVARMLRS